MKYRLFCFVLLLCVLLTACGGDEVDDPASFYAERGNVERAALGELTPAADAQALLAALTAAEQGQTQRWQPEELGAPKAGPRLVVSGDAAGDTVVTDGTNIYMLDSYGLVAVSAAGEASAVRSYTKVEFGGEHWGERLYLWQDRAAVVWNAADYGTEEELLAEPETRIVLFSLADPAAPEQISVLSVDGSLVDACLLGGNLCVVTQKTLLNLPKAEEAESILPRLRENDKTFTIRAGEIYLCPDPAKAALTVAAVIRLEDGRFVDALAFTDGTEAVRGDGQDLYLARTRWTEQSSAPRQDGSYTVVDYDDAAETEIKRLHFDRGLSLENGCRLYGALADPGAMDLAAGKLRVAAEVDERKYSSYTDESRGWTNYEGRSHTTESQFALMDENLTVVGALAKLGGETGINSCRFLNAHAWITSGEGLTLADLSDPLNPKVCAGFPAAGETLLVRAFGTGSVLGVSLPGPEERVQLTMYGFDDPAAPKELGSLEPEALPAGDLTARGALFTDPASGLIGWPVQGNDGVEYRLFRWTGSKFEDKGSFELKFVPENARALLLDGVLYICSPGQVCVTDPETMKVLAEVSNAVG
ncbi:MAG: beta-propeller domain-containing protein [Oscillospiraceae bacterium]|nr:beta-propeller domain-containing protein [Oscillospiraceae bacterium]